MAADVTPERVRVSFVGSQSQSYLADAKVLIYPPTLDARGLGTVDSDATATRRLRLPERSHAKPQSRKDPDIVLCVFAALCEPPAWE